MTSNAAAAALRVAAEHGYETTDPIVVQETNTDAATSTVDLDVQAG